MAQMDTNKNKTVEWDEFCSHMVHDLTQKEAIRAEQEVPLLVCPKLYDSPHRYGRVFPRPRLAGVTHRVAGTGARSGGSSTRPTRRGW